jgi:flagellar basal-body rod protein FlgC
MTEAAFDIAAGGMAAERSAMDIIARNLAAGGAGSAAGSAPGIVETPFVPASFSSALDDALSSAGSVDVEMPFANAMQWASTVDGADLELGAGDVPPGNSQAPQTGSDPIGQMIALVAAGRAYDADVAALQAAKQMDVEASDIDKF